ncbi:Tigger transposable element-derived protein 2 [Holothuria leucospilota]|uniref:Tigger transposable element-derived protein 2 n=1 Tax=Holothuria leucospilota TaxID=206669 RepID=A0A9Q1CE12_HOLLE|nr:Tigger transposable element-derived protein 2 [Holothuria leucospilota]
MREKGLKLRLTARMYRIPKSTLERHVKKEAETMNATTLKLGPTSCFSSVQEEELKKHMLELESRGFGLTPMEIRTLAYDYAEANNIEHKFNKQKRVAGYSWLEAFMRRNPSLSLRKPEPLSLARSMGMNKVRVQNFQSQLQDIFVRENFFDCPKAIYNVDETGISQVHKPPKIIGAKGKKNIYSTSSEKGTTVTAVVCGNAAGDFIPPFLIFKWKRSNPLLATGAPSGTVVELSENGWIDKAIFLRWLQFLIPCRRQARNLCDVLDGHASHLTIEVLKYANENKIMLLCLPPHSTHWMQPLDKTVFKSIKCSYDKACAKFMRDNPGKPITRYDISRLFIIAYHSGATMGNLVNGFKYTGIFSLDAKAIPDHAYAPAETTEQAKTIHLQEGAPPKSSENDDSVAPAETTGQVASNVL